MPPDPTVPIMDAVDPRGTRPAVVADGFTFQPAGPSGPTPLVNVSFQVAPGDSLLIAGPTGAGKSLLLSCIAGVAHRHPDPRSAGRLAVVFGDEDQHFGAARLPPPHPGRVAWVHQDAGDGLLGLDVLTSLALPLEEAGTPPRETVQRVHDALDRFGIGDLADRDIETLSGGERKRVALAGADAVDAGLVLLDEPLAGLDPIGVRQVVEDVHHLRRTRTLIIAEHRVDRIRPLVDQVLHLIPPRAPVARWGVMAGRPRAPGRAHVTTRDLTVVRGTKELIEGASLELGPGIWGVLGPNGSGKSSLLATLAGLLRPERGDVRVGPHDVYVRGRRGPALRRGERALRRDLAVAFQEPHETFFAATVADDVAAPLVALGHDASRATALRDAHAVLQRMGLAHVAERDPGRLSGGEARLVQVACHAALGPAVWMLDEPTHGLDPEARATLAQMVADLGATGACAMVATHEPDWLPAPRGWLFLPGDGRVVTGPEARPGAPEPRAAGYWGGDPA